MKKLLILFVLVVLIFTVTSVSLAKSSITLNPFGAIFGFYDGQYELQLGKNAGLILGGRFFNYELSVNDSSASFSGLGGRIGARIYPIAEFNGLFLQGHGGVNTLSITDGVETASGTAFNIEGQAGFKWVSDNGFTFEFGIGEIYTMTEVEGAENGFSTDIVLNVGYTF